jgi:ribonuclease BN (tRNA processing enzyme)
MKSTRSTIPLGCCMAVTTVIMLGLSSPLVSQTSEPRKETLLTAAVVFGVGSPAITAERSGTSIGIISAGTMYLFDAGAGVERRIMEARVQLASRGVAEFGPIFLTHLHIDHTLGLAALYRYHTFHRPGTLGLSGRQPPLRIFGPPGTRDLMDHVRAAFAPWNPMDVQIHEIDPNNPIVYRDAQVTVKAFPVIHKEPGPSFGYRVEVAGRVIVISGDTRPTDALIDACDGCDLLFHEVFSLDFGPGGPKTGEAQGHTSARELGELARRARTQRLVIYHDVQAPHEAALAMIRKAFAGEVTFARDLEFYELIPEAK